MVSYDIKMDDNTEVVYGKDDKTGSVFLTVKDKRLINDCGLDYPSPSGVLLAVHTGDDEGFENSKRVPIKSMAKFLQQYGVLTAEIAILILEIDENNDLSGDHQLCQNCGHVILK